MKKLLTSVLFATFLLSVAPASAQIKFGLKGGLNVTNMSFSSEVLNSSNRSGFFVGPTLKFVIPIVGLGVDASALYDQRESKMDGEKVTGKNLNIPINLRYTIGLGDLAGIFLAAGPQFGFNLGDKSYDFQSLSSTKATAAQYKLKDSQFSINVGAGVTLVNHLEIGATYNIVCGKTGDVNYYDAAGKAVSGLDGATTKTNAWQVSLAYYF
jgi:hypothetical protein